MDSFENQYIPCGEYYLIKIEIKNDLFIISIKEKEQTETPNKEPTKEYIGSFNLQFFKEESDVLTYFSLVGIKDFISNRILEKEYTIINKKDYLELTFKLNNTKKNLKLIIPLFNIRNEPTKENIIRLETAVINIRDKINSEIKDKIKTELKEEITKNIKEKLKDELKGEIKEELKNIIRNEVIGELKPKILFTKSYEYIQALLVNQKSLTEVPYYTQEFETTKLFNIVEVLINIPYTSMDTNDTHAKIITYLDEYKISDSTIYNAVAWELKPLCINGFVKDLPIGKHKVKIMACVDGGNLNIPHIHQSGIEYTIKPIVSGNIIIIGF